MSRIPKGTRVRHRPDVPFDRMRSGQIKYEHGYNNASAVKSKANAHAEEVVNEVLEKAAGNLRRALAAEMKP